MTDDDQSEWAGDYKHPPYEHRFAPGNSGNPRGRPRKAPRIVAAGDLAMQALYEPVPVVINGKKRKVPAIDAVILRGRNLALKSDKLLDVTRYLDTTAKLGFNYNFADGSARQEEKALFDRQLAELDRALKAAHRAMATSAEVIRRLTAELDKHQKPTG